MGFESHEQGQRWADNLLDRADHMRKRDKEDQMLNSPSLVGVIPRTHDVTAREWLDDAIKAEETLKHLSPLDPAYGFFKREVEACLNLAVRAEQEGASCQPIHD
jgi:hypothetical protein